MAEEECVNGDVAEVIFQDGQEILSRVEVENSDQHL